MFRYWCWFLLRHFWNDEIKPDFWWTNTFKGHHFLAISWNFVQQQYLEIAHHFLLLNYLNIFHTNFRDCLISSFNVTYLLQTFWSFWKESIFAVMILLNFCHTNCLISSFKKWLRNNMTNFHFYYEQQIKRELKGIQGFLCFISHLWNTVWSILLDLNVSRKMYICGVSCGCRCNERLKAKTDGSTRLTYTGLSEELENLKIETRLIGESFECVTGECVT